MRADSTLELPLAATGTRRSLASTLPNAAVLGLWLAGVIVTVAQHEFWRDEVRALSLARAAGSPADLYSILQYDGHPVLWYLLLHIGTSIVDSPLVLPIISIAIGFAATALFMFAAPFPFWFRGVFVFSALLFYEYSVMARNYGISVLLLFLAALLYRHRRERPVLVACTLALLANTNVHSALFASLAAGIWIWDMTVQDGLPAGSSTLRRSLPLAIVGAGVLLCLAFTMPRENTTLTNAGNAGVLAAAKAAILRPDETFQSLVPAAVPPKAAILLLYAAIAGLAARPNLLLAALAAQMALGVFFRAVYPGWYRHQGLYLVFLVYLYWLLAEPAVRGTLARPGRLLLRGGLYGAVLLLILVDVSKTPGVVLADVRGPMSGSRAFGEFLRSSPEFGNAVIVPEPDFAAESLPYYAGNPIYFPRERRFGTTVSWSTANRAELTLGELVASAREVKAHSGRPVLIVLGSMDPGRHEAGEARYMYGTVFSWNLADLDEFHGSTRFVGAFDGIAGHEAYRVYALIE